MCSKRGEDENGRVAEVYWKNVIEKRLGKRYEIGGGIN